MDVKDNSFERRTATTLDARPPAADISFIGFEMTGERIVAVRLNLQPVAWVVLTRQ